VTGDATGYVPRSSSNRTGGQPDCVSTSVDPIRLTIVARSTKRHAAPVHRGVREQSVLDLAPLAGAWREVTHRDGGARAVGKLLQFPPPETQTGTVAAARISGDQQRLGLAIGRSVHLLAPAPNHLATEVPWSVDGNSRSTESTSS
jgi:hypothetical protein